MRAGALAPWVVRRLHAAGRALQRRGDTAAAERLLRMALALAGRPPVAGDGLHARVCNDLGVVLKYTGGFAEAGRLYASALRMSEAAHGPFHPEVATVLHNIGGLAHAAGRPEQGEVAARRAVAIRERALGAGHPAVAADRAALAGILEASGRADEAAAALHDALAIFEHARLDLEIAATLAALGAIDARRGDLEAAEPRLRRALAMKEARLGSDHLELVPVLGTLGVVCRRSGRGPEAAALTRRALAMLERRGLRAHPQAATLRAKLARAAG